MRPLSAGPARLRRTLWMGFGTVILFEVLTGLAWAEADRKPGPEDMLARGRELFLKEWVPGLPSRHGGDGLGPVYNETSCVACHDQGGVGGSGADDRNVELLTVLASPMTASRKRKEAKPGGPKAERPGESNSPARLEPTLAEIHPGFAFGPTVVLHRYGTHPEYAAWKFKRFERHRTSGLFGADPDPTSAPDAQREILIEVGNRQVETMTPRFEEPSRVRFERRFVFRVAKRNAPLLFGLGLIDRLPDAVLEESAAWSEAGTFEVPGRVCQLEGGRIGRFGWKAQTATLGEFVRVACAMELGLEVPGHHQAVLPQDAQYRAPGLDLDDDECDALTAFVASLPAPVRLVPEDPRAAERASAGARTFARIGCAACHTPTLGPLVGIYSDLLLHDMGRGLSDSGGYGPSGPAPGSRGSSGTARFGAKPTEWRTPPLWALSESGPYLHDGRAKTLDEAIALHGGQARSIAEAYFKLRPTERRDVTLFLNSLTAPGQAQVAAGKEPSSLR